MPLTVSFRTFGCRLNQTETEAIAASFAVAGAQVADFGQASDIVVFNTCTVTTKAEQKARREMRQALRLNEDAVIIATGCYAELDPQALHALAPRLVVIPGGRKGDLPHLAPELCAAFAEGLDLLEETRRLVGLAAGQPGDPFSFIPGDFRFRARAALKIQDGCNNRCSYCRVCLARGNSISLDPSEIVQRARIIADAGIPEIVLTGVNLSQYVAGGLHFPGLLNLLCAQTDSVAFRISSYEPDKIDDTFLEAFAEPRVRPHLHLPVQSGSDTILGSMGRSYRRNAVLTAVTAAREVKGDPFIGMDIITGFPGETDDDFAATIDLLQCTDPAWVHAFVFSPRPGTKAFSMKPKVPERVAVARAQELAQRAIAGKQRFAARRIGTILEAVAESHVPDEGLLPADAMQTAVSADFLRLAVRGVPAGTKAEFSCLVSGPSSDQVHDLIADFSVIHYDLPQKP